MHEAIHMETRRGDHRAGAMKHFRDWEGVRRARPEDYSRQVRALPDPYRKPLPITKRQREIIELCASGLLDKEICDRLNLCRQTVDKHWAAIYERVGVRTHAGVVGRLYAGF